MQAHTQVRRLSPIPIAALLIIGCSQPPTGQLVASKPPPVLSVTEVRMVAPQKQGDPYRVQATLHHQTAGGPANVTFRLRNRVGGDSPETSGRVELTPGTVLVATAEVQAPAGNYTPEVQVQFPAR
jgi:hypothetical protein